MNLSVQSNSPLRIVPQDYCPDGSARWFKLPKGHDKDKTMFYFDYCVGEQPPQSTIVFVHGNPESSYTYRHIRDELIASGQPMRIVAMDHIGFGLSDQADSEMVDMHHSENLLMLIEELDLNEVTLVVHDWGGPIGIGAFSQQAHRVKNLVVMNTTIFPMPETGYTYDKFPYSWLGWSNIPRLVPNSLWGGIAAYVVSHASPQGAFKFIGNSAKFLLKHGLGLIKPTQPEYVWSQMLKSSKNAKSSKRNVLQTPYWGHGYSYKDAKCGVVDNHRYYQAMQQTVPQEWGANGRNIPVAGFFGQWDPCGKDELIEQWQRALPKIKDETHVYADVGHFIEEYKWDDIAQGILRLNAIES